MKKHYLIAVRLLFTALLIFEFLNWFEILHFKVEFTWLGLIITSGGVYGFLEYLNYYLKKYHQINLPRAAFLLGFIPVVYDAMGDVFHFYDFWWYDIVAHFFGSAAAAGIIFYFLMTLRRKEFIDWFLRTEMFFAAAAAVTFGVLYELEEFGEDLLTCYHRDFIPFLADKLLPCGMRFGNVYDTGSDLFFDVAGAAAAMLAAWMIMLLLKRAKKEKQKL